MLKTKTHKTAGWAILSAACVLSPCVLEAAVPVRLSGAIGGVVRDASSIPQMGATVLLFNHQDRLFEKVLTNDHGQFQFAALMPDVYSILPRPAHPGRC